VSSEEYHAAPGLSSTGLKRLAVTPAHYQAYLNEPRKETPALRFGRMLHEAVLEPERWADGHAVEPAGINKRTNAGKEELAAFEAENKGKHIITRDEADKIAAVQRACRSHIGARTILTAADGVAEQSVWWTDPMTGVLCKCRPDWWTSLVLADLKTCESAEQRAFSRAIYNYGYHMQAAFYADGVAAATDTEPKPFLFLAVEKKPPYAAAAYMADPGMMELGRTQYRRLLHLYAECEARWYWPGYPDEINPISLPAYAVRAIEETEI
jgi:hypothetical protein